MFGKLGDRQVENGQSEPTSTRTIEITIATIGRLMKNFDMTSPARRFRGEWFRIDPDAGAHLLHSFGDDPVTRD